MKGIILAGGSGTRLYPVSLAVSKQLLPVYDKPMIYYPMSVLLEFGIGEILIISTPHDIPNIERLFGTGVHLGIDIRYAEQPEPHGIAQAFAIGADFIGSDDVCLILGDNIFHIGNQMSEFRKKVAANMGECATIFTYHVSDPERFGVVEFDKNFLAISIEEKPKHPKSNYVSVGLYFYPNDVVDKVHLLKPSARGELEITDLNNLYLEEKRLSVMPMKRGCAWLDAGTPDSLMDSSQFVQIIEKRQGLKIACLEEIVYKSGFVNREQMGNIIDAMKDGSDYKLYLQKIYKECDGIR
ncbi:MAG: glucose-1-phosphate thymidylyltransferase RfbA [Puniceicoccales bacterium]|jgi:glucose-1-phosphate thymidylyltransferase|nr:glucose-1-phosphate thymidylyltransferase RfbA [Puniceicoccales bacterium]